MDSFLNDVMYVSGQYDEDESYEALHEKLLEKVRARALRTSAVHKLLTLRHARSDSFAGDGRQVGCIAFFMNMAGPCSAQWRFACMHGRRHNGVCCSSAASFAACNNFAMQQAVSNRHITSCLADIAGE